MASLVGNTGGPLLTIVVPVFQERDNVAVLVERVASALDGVNWEILFVDDDSPDETFRAVRDIAARDRRVRLLLRVRRRGLASASIEGMLASTAPFVAVMDADLQHDERLLPVLLDTLMTGELDIVVGSRLVAGGSLGAWSQDRQLASRVATKLSRLC
jgi:dolichol-phosphate mannosyltransferase